MDKNEILQNSLQRVLRIADQSCTAHSNLRDKYKFRSILIDCITLFLSSLILMTVFIQPEVAIKLSPSFVSPVIWIGMLSFIVFILTVLQLIVDWKGKLHAHKQAVTSLSSFVKEFRSCHIDSEISQALLQYRLITDSLEPIPEDCFLKLKRKHLIKLATSRHLDKFPGTSIFLFTLKLWLRDNCIMQNKQHSK